MSDSYHLLSSEKGFVLEEVQGLTPRMTKEMEILVREGH